MSIDYDRLRELLDAATPGPWEFHEEQEWEHVAGPEYPPMLTYVEHTVESNDGEPLFGNSNDPVLEERPGNLRLAALAPDMAAELLRLQDGIEAQRDTCARAATLCRSSNDPGAPAVASNLESVARALTRLLNGDTE